MIDGSQATGDELTLTDTTNDMSGEPKMPFRVIFLPAKLISPNSSGEYECSVLDSNGTLWASEDFYLAFETPPSAEIADEVIYADVGEEVNSVLYQRPKNSQIEYHRCLFFSYGAAKH